MQCTTQSLGFLVILFQDTLSDDARLLASAQSELRIIIRNVGGKFSWDGGILYGPSERSIGPQKPGKHITVSPVLALLTAALDASSTCLIANPAFLPVEYS